MSTRDGLRLSPIHFVDVLVYLVVLGLFVQFWPSVVSETFLVSLITAILLKLSLEVLVAIKTRILRRFKAAESGRVRIVAGLCLVAAAAGGKALILWLVAAVLGDAVHLGGYVSVAVLVITLMIARALVRLLLTKSAD